MIDVGRFFQAGTRPHALGGKIYECWIGDLVSFSWATGYDHVEDLRYALRGSVLVASATWAVGWVRGDDYVRLYVGCGELMIARPEPDEFEKLYGDRPDGGESCDGEEGADRDMARPA